MDVMVNVMMKNVIAILDHTMIKHTRPIGIWEWGLLYKEARAGEQVTNKETDKKMSQFNNDPILGKKKYLI